MFTPEQVTRLDNPIWHALIGEQAHLAEGDGLARRFPPSIGPLAAMIEQSAEAYASLAKLARPDEQLVLFLPEPAVVPAGWMLDVAGRLTQMVFEGSVDLSGSAQVEALSAADIPDMLALTDLTKPGPFRQRTCELGVYLGIRVQGRLAAMAGERLKPSGFTEVSAVCTHPDFQGKGYAKAVMSSVLHHIQQEGRTPFLHSRPDNDVAIGVYEKLGFCMRRLLHLAVVRRG